MIMLKSEIFGDTSTRCTDNKMGLQNEGMDTRSIGLQNEGVITGYLEH